MPKFFLKETKLGFDSSWKSALIDDNTLNLQKGLISLVPATARFSCLIPEALIWWSQGFQLADHNTNLH